MDDCEENQFRAAKRKSSESSAGSSCAKRSCSDLSLFPVHQHHQHHQPQQSPQTSFSAADHSQSCQQKTHMMSPLCSIFSSARVRRGSSESRSSSMIHQQTNGARAHSTPSLAPPPESSTSSNFSIPRSTMFSMIASSNPKSQPSIFLPSCTAPQPPQPSIFLPSATASQAPQPFFSVSRMLEHNQQEQKQKEHPPQQTNQSFSTKNMSSLRQDNMYLEQQQQQQKDKSLSAEANPSAFHEMLMGRNASLSNVFRYQPRAECNPKSSIFYPPAKTISSNNNHAMSLSDLTASGVPRTKNVAVCSDMKVITNSSMPSASLLTALSSWQALKSQVSTASTQHPPSDDCGGLYGVAINSKQFTSQGPAYNISTQKTPSEASHSRSLGCEDREDNMDQVMENELDSSTHSSCFTASHPRSLGCEDNMDQVIENEFDSSAHSSCFTADSAFSDSDEPQSWELSLDQGKNTYGISQSFVSPAALEQEMLGGGSSLVPEDSAGELPTLSPGPGLFHPDLRHTQLMPPSETLHGVSTVTAPDGTVSCLSDRDSSCVNSLKDPLRDSLQDSFRDSFRDSICSRISLNSNYSSLTFATAGTNATRKPRVRRRNAIVGPLMFGLGDTPEREENDQFSF